MSSLTGKRVLLIAPSFFGYANEIKKEIESRGAQVDFLEDRPLRAAWKVALSLIFPYLKQLAFARQYYQFSKRLDAQPYDFVLVINGESLTSQILLEVKDQSPKAKYVLYMWDGMVNKPEVCNVLSSYDVAFSFDRESAEKYGLKFRPLFFVPGFEGSAQKHYRYDISFIGTMHSDRYSFITKLQSNLPKDINAFWYLYLQAPWVYWVKRVAKLTFWSSSYSHFKFHPLNNKAVQDVFQSSRVILDIEHPSQEGLTMRTIEALGANKKLITTNIGISSYDFFNQQNICIVNRDKPEVPADFLKSEYVPVPKCIYDRYKLSGWVDEVLEGI